MPKSCAVVRCNSSARMKERKFFRFPMLNDKSAKSLALTQIRQDAWVLALNREDFFPSHYKNATVCDRHFVSGKSARYNDVENVDWVPTLHLGYQIKKEYDEQEESSEQSEFTKFLSVGTQTDDRYTGMSPDVILAYQEKVAFLEEMLCSNNITIDTFRRNDK